MVYFHTKNLNLGKFWRALEFKLLVFFIFIWYILWPFDIFMVICCIFPFWYVVISHGIELLRWTYSMKLTKFFGYYPGGVV
jgi:hypothetical protein